MMPSNHLTRGFTLLELTFGLAIASVVALLAGTEVHAFVEAREERAALEAFYDHLWEARGLAMDCLCEVTVSIKEQSLQLSSGDEVLGSYPFGRWISDAAITTESGTLSFARDGGLKTSSPVDLTLVSALGRSFGFRIYPAIGTIRRIP